jgi:mono/diheme cytochrome c family protein
VGVPYTDDQIAKGSEEVKGKTELDAVIAYLQVLGLALDNTTGHVWDEDLRELNNPLPRWWMYLFVLTVVFSAVYLAFYPGLGTFAGTLKWSSVGQYEAEQEKARQAMVPVYAKYATMTAEQLGADPQAMGIGQRLYLNNCAQCHGSDARGSKGFPEPDRCNDWLHGGDTAATTSRRDPQGRTGMMPPMAAAVGTAEPTSRTWPTTCCRCRAAPTRRGESPAGQGQVRRPAPPATAPTARATRPWARPT